jgi:fucose permease
MNNQRAAQGYIALLFCVMFIYGICNQAIGTLITRIIAHYGIGMAQAGLISSFTSAGNFAAIVVITVFVGRISKMILMGSSLLLYAASLYLISTAPVFAVILGSYALIGVFGATLDMLANSLTADIMPAKMNRNISLLHGFFGVGGLCGPVLMERLAENLNWAQVYFILNIIVIAYLGVYTVTVKLQWNTLKLHMPHEKHAGFGISDMVQFFSKKRQVLLLMTMFFYGGNQVTIAVWIKRYVETHLDGAAWGAYALSAMWLGIAISRLFISPVIKASSPLKICIGNGIAALALAAGLLSGSVMGTAAASLVVGLSSGFTIPLVIAIGCEWYREKTAFGTMMPLMAFIISCVVFPPLSGLVSDLLGIPWGVALGAASALLTAVFSAALELTLKTEKRLALSAGSA